MKELEKLATGVGIVLQSVKDVVNELVGDGIILTDKVGASNIYWALPSEQKKAQERLLTSLREEEARLRDELESMSVKLDEARKSAGDATYKANLDKMLTLQQETEELDKSLAAFRSNDPRAIQQKRQEIDMAKHAAERWTDNIITARRWMSREQGAPLEEINRHFEIPPELDEE
ncbi:unnamed protein product [Vitrella brassicaformis CCMP3155]|uniref:Meiotic nuclear division protein 1 homolog n=1 Tax=Vitrella brassicaformis (strain CCMP3155) TaxID=1169540 RepID=A0A0G4ERJ8_VITBC|nr:unnamed protein product [Vitrella brassicaformis CCMP3155]|eukprot:CEL99913.1 unnamed protein product [Vitrella brassicaformis CCMP3155]